MLGKKVGIDLGTSETRLIVKGEGIIASEPTVVAVRDGDVHTSSIGAAALGAAAEDEAVRLYRPMAGGAVADPAAMRVLINHAIVRAAGRQRIFKPDVVIAVMSGIPGDQRRALLEAATTAGARTVYLLDAAIASALGSGMRLSGPNGHLIVDVGAGKTEAAALAMEGTIATRCLSGHGGNRLSACIEEHVKRTHGVAVDRPTVEDIVASLARVGVHEERCLEVAGIDASDGSARTLTITSTELAGCLEEHARPIATALNEVLAETPQSLRADIDREGAVLSGGGAGLEGLDRFLSTASGVAVHVDGEPRLCAVRGTGHALDNLDVLKRNFMYIR